LTQISAAEQIEFDQQAEIADDYMCDLLDETPDDVDVVGVAFSLWVNLTQFLASAGWAAEDLIKDVHHHVALGTTEGGMN
jgi:hypothetical protein